MKTIRAVHTGFLTRVLLAALVTSSSHTASAQTLFTTGQLRDDCALMISQKGRYEAIACPHFVHGFLMGCLTAQRESMVQLEQKYEPLYFCLPKESDLVNPIHVAREFVKWADRNRQHWHWPAISGFRHALSEQYPCKPWLGRER